MNWYLFGITIGLFLLGIFFFFFLATRKKYRDPSAAQNYEKVRNKLTLRELDKPKIKKEADSSFVGGFLSNIISGFIVILIGISLIGPITKEVKGACNNQMNVTSYNDYCTSGASHTILGLTPIFFALAILISGLSIAFRGLRNAGIV